MLINFIKSKRNFRHVSALFARLERASFFVLVTSTFPTLKNLISILSFYVYYKFYKKNLSTYLEGIMGMADTSADLREDLKIWKEIKSASGNFKEKTNL